MTQPLQPAEPPAAGLAADHPALLMGLAAQVFQKLKSAQTTPPSLPTEQTS